MATKDEALRPDFSVRRFVDEVKDEDVETLTKDEQVLAQGGSTAFWKTLKAHYLAALEGLELINEQAIAKGATREQIGENAIVISTVKSVLKKIINIVEDAKEARDTRGREEQGTGGK